METLRNQTGSHNVRRFTLFDSKIYGNRDSMILAQKKQIGQSMKQKQIYTYKFKFWTKTQSHFSTGRFLQTIVLELDKCNLKMNLNPYFTPCTIIN